VFGGKPVAIIGASTTAFGALLSQSAWLPVLKRLGAPVWSGGRIALAKAHTLFTEDGVLSDEATKEQLRTFLARFIASIEGR
jgi:NAD(P)H-dependent FMN reductase